MRFLVAHFKSQWTLIWMCLMVASWGLSQDVLINEVDADTGDPDDAEFAELYDGGIGFTPLDGMELLIADCVTTNITQVIDLAGYTTDSRGYFLLGGSNISGTDIVLASDSLPDNEAGVILYQGSFIGTTIGDLVGANVIDGMVYGMDDPDCSSLLAFLNPGQPQINENQFLNQANHAAGRYPNGSGGLLNTESYVVGLPTPGMKNHSIVLINEVDVSSENEEMEFIELCDGEVGFTPLDGLVVVRYDGDTNMTYGSAIDLDGYTTDENGFFLIGCALVPGVDIVLTTNSIQNGVDAIALFAGDAVDFPSGTPVDTEALLDALVYETNDALPSGCQLMDLLLTNQPMINEDYGENAYIHSMQRFQNHTGGNRVTNTYVMSKPTPKALNRAVPLINELDVDQAGNDTKEFIEIYDQGVGNTPLDGYVVVLYDGETDTSYAAFDLDGTTTNEEGFLLLANSTVIGVDIPFAEGTLQDGPDAVAIFNGDDSDFPNGSPVVTANLVDAVVYDVTAPPHQLPDAGLAFLLEEFQPQVSENALELKDEHSLQRFPDGAGGGRVTEYISPAFPTPKMHNSSRTNRILINEVDGYTGAVDILEFIELYDGGDGHTPLDGLVLVFYNGVSDSSYAVFDLNGYATDEDGYFLLANFAVAAEYDLEIDMLIPDNTLQNGPDAVALYLGHADDFPPGTGIVLDYIEDAVVYETNDSDDPELLTLLNAGQPQADESERGNAEAHSVQRFPNGSGGIRNTYTFAAALPTPRMANMEGLIINEVDSDTVGTDTVEFVELYDGGRTEVSLDGLCLVFYNGLNDEPYLVIDLNGYTTDSAGYFTVGNAGVIPAVNLVIDDDSIENGPDAVALYNADATNFQTRAVSTDALIDAVVYDTDDPDDGGLLVLLNSGQQQLNENALANKDGHSLQRSPNGSGGRRNSETFLQAVPTPSAKNIEYSYTTRFTELDNPGNPGGLNQEADDAIFEWEYITSAPKEENAWSTPREIGFDFLYFGHPVTEFKVSQNGLLTFATSSDMLPADDVDNIDLTTQNQFHPILPNLTICAFWDSFTDQAPTGNNDIVYIKTFGAEPNRQLWIKWHSFEYGSPSSSFNYFAVVLEEGTNNIYMVDMNHFTEPPITSTVAVTSTPTKFVQYTPDTIPPDEIRFFEGGAADTAIYQDNDFYAFYPISNIADLELAMTRPGGIMNVGDQVTYLVQVINQGPHGATDVAVQVDLSDKLAYVGHDSEGRPFDPFTNVWQVGYIPPQTLAVLVITVDVLDSHEVVNGAEIIAMSGYDPDSVPNNHILAEDDQVELIEIVPNAADLEIQKTADNETPYVQEQVTYTLTLTNHGPDPANNMQVQDILPVGVTYVSDNGGGSFAGDIWTVGSLDSGVSTSLEIVVLVHWPSGTPDSSITNTATIVAADEYDPDLDNNEDSVVIFYRRYIWEIEPISGETAINTYIAGIQAFPAIAIDPMSAYTITWQSEGGQDGDLSGVFGRQLTFPVTFAGPEYLVNFYTENHQRYAQVDMNDSGHFTVAWQDEGQNGLWEGIFATQFDAAGQTVLPGQFAVNQHIASTHVFPDVAVDSDGDQIMIWESIGQDPDGAGIYGRLYDATNTETTGEFQIHQTTTGDQSKPSVACDANGNFVVVWQSWNQDGEGWGIYGRRFANDSTPLDDEFLINQWTGGDQENADIAMSPTGEFVVVWQTLLADGGYGIMGRYYDSMGTPVSQEFLINTYTTGLAASPSVSMDSYGNFVAVWYTLGQDGDGAGVFGQQYGNGPHPEGPEFQVNTTSLYDQSFPAVACDPEGNFVVTWQSFDQDGDDEGIFARAFLPPCEPLRSLEEWPTITILELLACL